MKSRLIRVCMCFAGLMACGASFAQMGPMRVPMVPQSIEMHMQQQRTLEQREAIEAAAAAKPAPAPPASPAPKKPAAKKAKKAQDRKAG